MSKRKNEQEDKSKVKLYKTKHGWFSALTRFFKLFSFSSKKEVQEKEKQARESLLRQQQTSLANLAKGSQVGFSVPFFDTKYLLISL